MAAPRTAPASAQITLRNLVTSRWVLLGLVLIAALLDLAGFAPDALGAWVPATEHPLATFAALAAWAGHNAVSMVLVRRDRASDGYAGVHLLVDATVLTVLLALAGGSANPFTILYFLPLTLATQVSPRWTWALAAWSLACFASLFVLTPEAGAIDHGAHAGHASPAEPAPPPSSEPAPHAEHDHGHHEHPSPTPAPAPAEAPGRAAEASASAAGSDEPPGHFADHQRGMWIAFGLTGVLMTVFVHRTALAIARQRAELVRLRQEALQDRHLAAIGTLAAGAAHELGTPLGTIKLLVDELPLMDPGERDEALTTVREQLGRCKLIVSRMASPQLRVEAVGPGLRAWSLSELETALTEPEPGVPVELRVSAAAAARTTQQPFEVLAQLLRELVANAAEACRRSDRPNANIVVTVDVERDDLHLEVRDTGVGMDADTLAAAFDPFFSTRPEGEGMGLGLYLARAHLRQLGGKIELESSREPDQGGASRGAGTTVRVHLPLATAVDGLAGARR